MSKIKPLREFVIEMTRWVEVENDESNLLGHGQSLLKNLVSDDCWLPDIYAKPNPKNYTQNLLWCDPLERFSLVSFVWGPGQVTPIHDHTVWGLVGILRGSEVNQNYSINSDQKLEQIDEETLKPGMVTSVSPTIGDIHKVSNGVPDQTSISIHLYGANIGALCRHSFDPETGATEEFMSGYSNFTTPNLFDRSSDRHTK